MHFKFAAHACVHGLFLISAFAMAAPSSFNPYAGRQGIATVVAEEAAVVSIPVARPSPQKEVSDEFVEKYERDEIGFDEYYPTEGIPLRPDRSLGLSKKVGAVDFAAPLPAPSVTVAPRAQSGPGVVVASARMAVNTPAQAGTMTNDSPVDRDDRPQSLKKEVEPIRVAAADMKKGGATPVPTVVNEDLDKPKISNVAASKKAEPDQDVAQPKEKAGKVDVVAAPMVATKGEDIKSVVAQGGPGSKPVDMGRSTLDKSQADIVNASEVSVARPEEWALKAGVAIHLQLAEWAKKAGWNFFWKSPKSWMVPADSVFTGSFDVALESVVRGLFEQGRPLRLVIWEGNKVAEIINADSY